MCFQDKRFKLPAARIIKLMKSLVADIRAEGSVTLIFINEWQMRKLNQRFLGKRKTTDVLAFNLANKRLLRFIEGEIYVNLQAARRQASEYMVSYHEEATRLCIHGLLHLLGYKDDSPAKHKKMWLVQEHYLKGKFDGTKR